MPNNNKNEFDNKKPSQTQEHAIHKSLNAAILTDIITKAYPSVVKIPVAPKR